MFVLGDIRYVYLCIKYPFALETANVDLVTMHPKHCDTATSIGQLCRTVNVIYSENGRQVSLSQRKSTDWPFTKKSTHPSS